MSLSSKNGSSPRKMTKAAAFLNSISNEESGSVPVLKPKTTNENNQTIISPTASPIKKSERPLNSVQQMIKAKEQETKENHAFNFTPRPDNKTIKDRRNIFVTKHEKIRSDSNNNEEDKLSKSEINRMGVINTAMSNSPSKKNLNKLKNIQSRLENLSTPPTPALSKTPTNSSQGSIGVTMTKTFSTKNLNKQVTTPSSIAIKNWLDTDRDNLKLAAFVCRMVEIKNWIEKLLNIDISLDDSNIDQFPDYLTNGILLAQIAQHFDPSSVKKVYTGLKATNIDGTVNYKMTTKQFKFTENIVKFLDFSRNVKLPSLFIFETNDLYEKKDIPKVIACLHALSCLMAMMGRADPVDKLDAGGDVSVALLNLNVNVDTLKQIKHKVGRFAGSLGRKYVEGFDEAVRINVGDDIRKLQLVQVKESKPEPVKDEIDTTITKDTKESTELLKSVEIPVLAPESSHDTTVSTVTDEDVGPLLSLDLDNTDLDMNLSDDNDELDITTNIETVHEADISVGAPTTNSESTLTEPSSPDSPLILPPSAEEQAYTNDARLLFNKEPSTIPSMPSVHSISDIQKKYQFLIDEDEREILGGSYLQSSTFNNNNSSITLPQSSDYYSKNTSPEDEIVQLQSIARGYLLRFDLFVTKAILKGNTNCVIKFQSICRGVISRRKYTPKTAETSVIQSEPVVEDDSNSSNLSTLDDFGSSDLMKTILKNKKKHGELIANLSTLRKQQSDIVNLQSFIRGMFIRQHYWEVRKFLLHEINVIIRLQSLIRGNIIRKKIANKTYFNPLSSKIKIIKGSSTKPITPSQSLLNQSPIKIQPSSAASQSSSSPIKIKKERVRSKRVSLTYDNKNPLLAPYDEDELFERFDIPTTSPKKKFSSNKKDSENVPKPGRVPRRKETRMENAKYVPNLPIDEPTTPQKDKRLSSRLQHSPTKVSLSEFVLPPESRLSSSETVLFRESKPAAKKFEDMVTFEQMNELEELADNVTDLQSFARGGLSRNRMNKFIDQIFSNEEIFSNFIAQSRGVLARKAYREIRDELKKYQNDVILIQSTLRGIETRVELDCLAEDLYDYSDCIEYLQSDIRGYLVRKRIRDRDAWFRRPDNLKKICRLQAIIRGLHGIKDFRTLIDEKNPPLRAVKRFAGILGGIEAEKTSRDEFEVIKLREEIKLEKHNVKHELDKLSKLKTKVGILKKNGIDIKSVEGGIRNNVNAGNAALVKLVDVEDKIYSDVHNHKTTESKGTTGEVVIQKEYDMLNEYIGNFFFILQTKPEYWGRVLNYIEMTGDIVEFSHGNVEDWILKCFGYIDTDDYRISTEIREECLYMKLIVYTFKLYLARYSSKGFKDVIKSRWELETSEVKYWELLIHAFLNLPQQRKDTKKLLGDAIFLITSDDEASFECEPARIYHYLLRHTNEINESEKINVDVGNLDPLEIPCVEQMYIKNMQDLRGSVYEIFKYLKKIVNKFPKFIRCLCREIYESMKMTLDGVSDTYILGMTGSVFMRCFILPIFQSPGNYSINVFAISEDLDVVENVQRNLELVAILLNQCVFMKHFDINKYPYLISLNPFIDELSGQMKEFIRDLIDVPLIDVSYRKVMLETSQENMYLKIQYDDIEELVFIWKEFIKEIFGERGDLLYYSIKEIEDAVGTGKRKKDKKKLPCDSSGYTIIKLVDGKEETGGVDNVIAEAMMVEVKKYLIYILQVQDGKDLVDLLVSEIEPADELKFKEIVKQEKKLMKQSKVRIPERKAINEIHHSSFPQVKKHALELIFELEKMGMISQKDGYQNLLNDIANDIRNKRKQQEERNSEKAIIVETLTELKRRSRTYQKKYKEYDETISGVLNQRLMKGIQAEENGGEIGSKNKAFLAKLFSRSGRKIKKTANVMNLGRNRAGSSALYGQHKMSVKHMLDKGIIAKVSDNLDMESSGFASSFKGSSKLGRINVVAKCNKPGYFELSLHGGNVKNDTIFYVNLDDLLMWEYEGRKDVDGFDGDVTFYCAGLLKFVLSSFYSV